ncbi:MAG: hypothetical protein ACXADH_03495 [Candidatus Kariarchaeaceae archaeon]|jgi:hypothetical protein
MADVQGNALIKLRPGDNLTYEFEAAPCSSRTANDGAIPYGTNVSSILVKAYMADGAEATDIVNQQAAASNIVSLVLTYPATNGGGQYQLRFALTLDNAEVINKRFDNLLAVEDDS